MKRFLAMSGLYFIRNMVNIYKCERCGWSGEIPQEHEDNEKINAAGILYLDSCECCDSEEEKEE